MKNGASPFLPQTFIIEAGQSQDLPGQYTWLEILSEFETSAPAVNSAAIAIAFNTAAGPNAPVPVPPGFTVIADDGFPLINPQLINTGDVTVTVTIVGSAGKVGVDHRIVFPVGSLIDVFVNNTDANPIPVALTGQPVAVTVKGGATAFSVTAGGATNLVPAADNLNGILLGPMSMFTTAGHSSALCYDDAGDVPVLYCPESSSLILSSPFVIPAGNALTINNLIAANVYGAYTIL